MDDRNLLIALNAAERLARPALCRLAEQLDTWCRADGRAMAELSADLGVPRSALQRAFEIRRGAAQRSAAELRLAERRGVRLLTCFDAGYPRALRDLALPPPVLYVRGCLPDLDAPTVAVVGSRRMDAYGREVAELFASRLAAAGVTIVSGFAVGVDGAAHRASMRRGGPTLAVLGCGVDVRYPRAHDRLGDEIARGGGALISEFPFGAGPRPWRFPVRNRVIAALARATLVVQGKLRSGSLSTAHHALELGRDIFAIPGRIFDELSLGTNALLADGALLASCPEDVLEAFGLIVAPRQRELFAAPAPTTEELAAPAPEPLPAGAAGKLLASMPVGKESTAEDLAGQAGCPVDRILALLLELELGGWVRRAPGPVYVR